MPNVIVVLALVGLTVAIPLKIRRFNVAGDRLPAARPDAAPASLDSGSFRVEQPGPVHEGDPQTLGDDGHVASVAAGRSSTRGDDLVKDFVSAVLAQTEDVWRELFRTMGMVYREPRLVLFTDRVRSQCGLVTSAAGPSYCPRDEKVYLDTGFFREIDDRFHATGDFARAYVIAHEIGHHIQKLLASRRPAGARPPEDGGEEAGHPSIRHELQADFLAGVWAHHAHKRHQILEPGDVEAALRLLKAIGDERLSLKPQDNVLSGALTRCWDRAHGTSQQKIRWFNRGLESGDLSRDDAMTAKDL
jgi:predicted metalloprotease